MQISYDGYVQIPPHLLKEAGLLPPIDVDISVEGGKLVFSTTSIAKDRVEQLRKRIAGHQINTGLNADDIMRLMRD